MKRAISLILAIMMCLSLCACGGKSDNIKLTLDNYSTYLSVDAKMYNGSIFEDAVNVQAVNNGRGIPYKGGSTTFYVYEKLSTFLEVKGASTNFNYNDVSITVRFTGTYQTVDINTCQWDNGNEINTELTVQCNIAGEGNAFGKFSGNGGYMYDERADVKWEVVAISGTVSPAK